MAEQSNGVHKSRQDFAPFDFSHIAAAVFQRFDRYLTPWNLLQFPLELLTAKLSAPTVCCTLAPVWMHGSPRPCPY